MDTVVEVGQFHYFSGIYKGYGHSPYLIVRSHMRTLTVIFLILSFSAFGQKFPVILDPLEPNGNLSTIHMIQGGFEIIGISDNFETFR
ncbi:MAG: hypothetical protein RLO09_07385, partial [Cyclobacteriaceae bacterium]